MNTKTLRWYALAVLLLIMGIIQFIPSPAVQIPAQLPPDQRPQQRLLGFEGISNFRDLGGYPAADGRAVRWGVLYRSATLAQASNSDLDALQKLDLHSLIDFRSAAEKEEEPDRVPEPPGFELLAIPTMDGGDHSVADEIMARIDSGDFSDFDPDGFMLTANRQFASDFTPQYRQFMQRILQADGDPVLWHCSAGKDRAGYASAILLRILGVSQDIVMQDYLLSKDYALAARSKDLMLLRLFKGEEAATKLGVIMGVEPAWLEAAFEQIDTTWGSFDEYVRSGLQLSQADVLRLRQQLLE